MANTIFAGLIEFLENECDAREVEVSYGAPAGTTEVMAWERQQKCVIPEDLRQFYITSNGVSLCWSYFHNGGLVHMGTIHVNSLKELISFHGMKEPISGKRGSSQAPLQEMDIVVQQKDKKFGWCPLFGSSKIFVLDFSSLSGHICLVFDESNDSSIWLLDLSLSWHYICPSFSDFLRLAVIHLGLLQWPYALTPYGVSPHYEKWFHLFVPKRLELDRHHVLSHMSADPESGTNLQRPKLSEEVEGVDLKSSVSLFKNHLDISKVLYSSALKDKKQQSSTLPPVSTRKPQTK